MQVQKRRQELRSQRARRIRAGLLVTDDRPRLSVFRSNKHIRGQVINLQGHVLVSASDEHISGDMTGVALAEATGALLAQRAKKASIGKVVFDKGHYKYHGRVKAFAEGARKGGLEF